MKVYTKKIALLLSVFAALVIMMPDTGFAETPVLPFLDYNANFSYIDGVGGSNSNKYKLTFNTWNITGGNYSNGSYFGEGSDTVTNAVISIGNLFNDSYNQNLTFGYTNNGGSGANGVTGPVSFTIANGATTYLTAQLNNFLITDNIFGTRLNPLWDKNVSYLSNITFSNIAGSQYMQELQSSYNNNGYINLGMAFTFYSGTNGGGYAFSNDAGGTVSGKMVVTPEPISSILFVTGAATLSARRFIRKKKGTIS